VWVPYSAFVSQLHSIVRLWYLQLFSSWSMQWISSLPSFFPHFPFPSIRLSHYRLDGWSAGTKCAAFHIGTSFLLPAISSARTHHRFSQSFHLTQYIHYPSIYFWPVTASTLYSSNSSDSSSCVVLGVLISRVPCTPSLQVKNLLSRPPSIQPTSSARSSSACR